MIAWESLPALNAILNASAALLLVIGFVLIRRRQIRAHRNVMLTAFGISLIFLISYLAHHYHAGVVYFRGTGLSRTIYLWILGTHTILAAITPVLAIITLSRALSARYDKHRRIARWTLPVWLYVSVTGVIVYLMLY